MNGVDCHDATLPQTREGTDDNVTTRGRAVPVASHVQLQDGSATDRVVRVANRSGHVDVWSYFETRVTVSSGIFVNPPTVTSSEVISHVTISDPGLGGINFEVASLSAS